MSAMHLAGEGADMRTAKRVFNISHTLSSIIRLFKKTRERKKNRERERKIHTQRYREREQQNGSGDTCKSLTNFCSSLAYSVENELNVEESLNDMSLQMTSAATQNEKPSERVPREADDCISIRIIATRTAHKLRLARATG